MKIIRVKTSMAALLFAGLWGCSTGNTDVQLPATNPDIQGVITQVNNADGAFHIMVEADPSDSVMSASPAGTPKSRVRITERAQLLARKGIELRAITTSDLNEGRVVSVWFDGPVLQSYPSQSGAKVVVLEE